MNTWTERRQCATGRTWSLATTETAGEHRAPWKRRNCGSPGKPNAGFPPLPPFLGNLANGARFPLSHRAYYDFSPQTEKVKTGEQGCVMKPDTSCAIKSGQ